MRGFTALIVLLAGCSFDKSGLASDDGGRAGPDAGPIADADPNAPDADPSAPDAIPLTPDATPLAPDAMSCPGDRLTVPHSNIDPCDIPEPLGSVTMSADSTWEFNTTTGTLIEKSGAAMNVATRLVAQTSGGPMVRVISVDSLTISGDTAGDFGVLFATGQFPVVLVAFGDVTVNGALFAGTNNGAPGPGGNDSGSCSSGTGAAGFDQGDSATGGGGGAFGERGGKGSKATFAMGNATPTAGGAMNGNNNISPLRGGCAGGAGGGRGGGPAGAGGGGIQLIVEGILDVRGLITVRGGGGLQPQPSADQPAKSGGGGGGSGGAILLEANSLLIRDGAAVTANGGGGGEGTLSGGTDVEFPADAGENGASFDDTPAPGGASAKSAGGDGGAGGSTVAGAQDAIVGEWLMFGSAAGGGGGGSVGRIRFRSPSVVVGSNALISPPNR